jgi:hypothetical protein
VRKASSLIFEANLGEDEHHWACMEHVKENSSWQMLVRSQMIYDRALLRVVWAEISTLS